MAGFLRYVQDAPLVVEGYSTAGGTAQEYIRSRARGQLVLDYLASHFGLASNRTVVMPLGHRAAGSPDGETWDGVALALFVDRKALRQLDTSAGAEPVVSGGGEAATGP